MAAEAEAKQPAPNPNDFWWDMSGWVLLAAAIGGALIIAKATGPASQAAW
jgi:hypothetical protein